MWDDLEVRNDWDAATVPPELAKSGRQAFFEYMPLRESCPSAKGCIGAPLFRLFRWGAEALFLFIDTRSCRGQTAIQACAPRWVAGRGPRHS